MKKLSLEELNRLTVDEYKQAVKFPVSVILDNIRSMHNVGSFFRTCDAFRIQKLFLCGYTPTPPHREITRSALGAEQSVDWEQISDTLGLVRYLKSEGHKIFAVEQADESIDLCEFIWDSTVPVALIFGNEVYGVSEDLMTEVDGCIEISQFGTKHSLNVAVSAGIVLWKLVNTFQADSSPETTTPNV